MLSQIPEAAVWAIFVLPIASLVLILAAWRTRFERYSGHIAAVMIGGAFLLSLWALDSSIAAEGHRLAFDSHRWFSIGDVTINFSINLDGLTALMLVVVTSVSCLVQVYSQGYMHGDTGYWRYFAYTSLFTASMLGLVLADSLVMVYFFWELVGVSSYLLIGFWFDRPAAAAAAKKAFLVTRFGDVGFMLAILLIYAHTGTFDIAGIQEIALAGGIGATALTFFGLGVFAGAAGKSAQVPFHVWLPDAMEGPTPVSALIHAATMVAAGVYLVARMFPIYHASPDAMAVVGAVGGITAISAALVGIVMTDLKRVLAYSTISQLGYMMLALGSGAYVAAIFHLMTHAFFKALLFLGSGSVNHATNTFDMRLMGGLRKVMPITFWTFLIGSLSLSGFFPLAGFWSKDEILSETWTNERYLFVIALATAGITAFYMFRAIFLTFGGEYRGGAAEEHDETPAFHDDHAETTGHGSAPHESPSVMTIPLLILAVPAIFAGFVNINHGLEELLAGALPASMELPEPHFHLWIAIVSTIVPLCGAGLAWAIYSAKTISAPNLERAFGPAHRLLANRYYADTLYEKVIVGFLFYQVLGGALMTFDRIVVDGAVNGTGRLVRQTSSVVRYAQNGQFQTYGAFAFAGLLVTVVLVLILGGN